MSALFLSTDLVFSSRLAASGRPLGVDVGTVSSVDLAAARLVSDSVELVILDLSLASLDPQSAVARLRAAKQSLAIIAYAPHVHEDRLRAAAEAGCDLVLTRGQFDRQMDEILATHAARK